MSCLKQLFNGKLKYIDSSSSRLLILTSRKKTHVKCFLTPSGVLFGVKNLSEHIYRCQRMAQPLLSVMYMMTRSRVIERGVKRDQDWNWNPSQFAVCGISFDFSFFNAIFRFERFPKINAEKFILIFFFALNVSERLKAKPN